MLVYGTTGTFPLWCFNLNKWKDSTWSHSSVLLFGKPGCTGTDKNRHLEGAEFEWSDCKGARAAKELHTPWLTSGNQNSKQFSLPRSELPLSSFRTSGIPRPSENQAMQTGTTIVHSVALPEAASHATLRRSGSQLTGTRPDRFLGQHGPVIPSAPGSIQAQRRRVLITNWRQAPRWSISMATAALCRSPTTEVTGSFGSYNTYHRRQLLYRSARQASDFERCLSLRQLPNRLCRRHLSRPLRFLLWRTDLAFER